jgi:hypothetical protein
MKEKTTANAYVRHYQRGGNMENCRAIQLLDSAPDIISKWWNNFHTDYRRKYGNYLGYGKPKRSKGVYEGSAPKKRTTAKQRKSQKK